MFPNKTDRQSLLAMSPSCEAFRVLLPPTPLDFFLFFRKGGGVLCERPNVQPRSELGSEVTAAVAVNDVWHQQTVKGSASIGFSSCV
jgi:hypothetical protein